jgi:GWxTD domain-containing protein
MKFILFIVSLFFTISCSFAQATKNLKVYTDYNFYYDPSLGEYIELKFQFDANSLVLVKENSWFMSKVEVEVQIMKDSTKIVRKLYAVESPKYQDSIFMDFFDVKRYPLKPGSYQLLISFRDPYSKQKAVFSTQAIVVPDLHTKIYISDIQVCENIRETSEVSILSKSGYALFPRLINYFPADCQFLPTYLELYNPSKDSVTLRLKTSFYKQGDTNEIADMTRFSDVVIQDVTPIIQKNIISNLSTGSYRMVYSLLQGNTILCTSAYFFDRMNEPMEYIATDNIVLDPIFQKSIPNDSLTYYLASIIPVANPMEIPSINKLVKENDLDKMRKYMQSFWVTTSGRLNASNSWLNYKEQVKMVEKTYSTAIFKGYESDRGRVYLKYGQPSAIAARETSPSEYPYEIWQYDKIQQFSNKRFVFYNPDLVDNHYQLLHSDMQGELKNYRWQQLLTKRNSPNQNIDDPNDGNKEHYGGESMDVYNQY